MEKIDRIQRLHRLLTSYRHPVPTSTLVERMQCSESTVKRDIEYLQDCFNAPIEYDKERRGWHYNLKQDEKFELPGLWLTTEELQSLIALITLINSFDEGVLAKETGIIEHAIEDMLRVRGIEQSQITQKIKYLPIAKCFTDSTVFMSVCETLFRSVQAHLTYVDRSGKQTHRTVSPQTLLHYRENWYLDCWCHKRNQLRTFSLSRIKSITQTQAPAKECSKELLEKHFEQSYGIFSGESKHTAILKFSPKFSHDIASQQWHPKQKGEWQGDSYILQFPYNDDRELILDILKYGAEVQVMAPKGLRVAVIERLRETLQLYDVVETV